MDPTTITAVAGAVVLVIGAVVTGAVRIMKTIAELKSDLVKAHDTIKEVRHSVANGYISGLEHNIFELRTEIILLQAEIVKMNLRGEGNEEGY